ncbi:transposase [Streptomyces sp. TE33382]
MPERYGPWARVYGLFRRGQRDGTWQRLFAELRARADANKLITWDLDIESIVCRAHQHAAGAGNRRRARGVRVAQGLMVCSVNWPQERNPRRR